MTTYLTADLHIDHEGILEMCVRPFNSIVEHNEHLIEQINKTVGKNDRLYILGDVGWTSPENFLGRLNCKDLHLIWGNHDRAGWGKFFKSQQDVLEIKIGQKPDQHKMWLSHYPHAFWPGSHHGWFHGYGHVHRQREQTLEQAFPGRRALDVGIDNARHLLGEYRPFSETEIISILGHRPGHDPVSFYEAFQAEMKRCNFVPPTFGYDACTRTRGHDGPCAHESTKVDREEKLLDKLGIDNPTLRRMLKEFVNGDGTLPRGLEPILDRDPECQAFVEQTMNWKFAPLQRAVAELKRLDIKLPQTFRCD